MTLAEFKKLRDTAGKDYRDGKNHKYKARVVVADGIRFSSKKEAKYYGDLQLAQKSGELLYFLRQTTFDLPGGIRYRVDFVEFWENGEIRYIDVKGYRTKEYIIKKKLVESLYPIKIIEVS